MYGETNALSNELDEIFTEEKYFNPTPVPLLPNTKSRALSVCEARKNMFISSKLFATQIKVNPELNKPYITFSNLTEIKIKSITLIHNIELFLYIRWCHNSYATEVGIFFYKTKVTRNLNIEGLIYALNRVTTENTYIPHRDISFKGRLFNYREKDKISEIYLDLNPAVLPNIVLLFSNFISLKVLNNNNANIETDGLIKYSNL